MKDYKHIEHMRNLNDSLIWERMKRCYDYGYEDGKADTPFTDTEEAEKKAYQRGFEDGQKEKPQAIYEMKVEEYNKGLNESWECARKIAQTMKRDEIQKSGKCKNCKYFEYDSVAKVDGVPLIVAHEICNKWGDGCKSREDGYCFLFEPQERSDEG